MIFSRLIPTSKLFDNILIKEVEVEISTRLKVELSKSNSRILSKFSIEEIKASLIDKKDLLNILKTNREHFVDFGVMLYQKGSEIHESEDYPKGEYIPIKERPITIKSHGIAIGFSITYLIYYYFLVNDKTADLLDFLNRRKYPKAKKFMTRLIIYFNETKK